jgi:hypothetical protein
LLHLGGYGIVICKVVVHSGHLHLSKSHLETGNNPDTVIWIAKTSLVRRIKQVVHPDVEVRSDPGNREGLRRLNVNNNVFSKTL